MTRYLISFSSDAMDHIPQEAGPDVADAAHAVVHEAKHAGVFVFAGGVDEDVDPVLVAGDGKVTAAPTHWEASPQSTCPHGTQPWNGPRRSPPPAAVLKRSARSATTQRWATDRSPTWPTHAHGPEQNNRLPECRAVWPLTLTSDDRSDRRK